MNKEQREQLYSNMLLNFLEKNSMSFLLDLVEIKHILNSGILSLEEAEEAAEFFEFMSIEDHWK